MVDLYLEDQNKYFNYKELLKEIHTFVSCPDLLSPIDDSFEIDNFEKEETDLEDEDDELTKQLDSQLFNVLLASGSSICDSESLISSREFSSSDEEEDDFDKIVEQLQTKSSENGDAKCSMPSLSTLLTCQQQSPSTCILPEPVKSRNTQKINGKKIKFVQHQIKLDYTFKNQSSVRLFDKIIRNNFHRKAIALRNSKVNLNNLEHLESFQTGKEKYKEVDKGKDSVKSTNNHRQSNKNENSRKNDLVNESDFEILEDKEVDKILNESPLSIINPKTKEQMKVVKRKTRKVKEMKKPKSEILTLKSNSINSTLENLFNSIKSK